MLDQEVSYILEKLPFCCSNKIVFFFWFFQENQLRCWVGISLSLLSITYVIWESQIQSMSYFHDSKDWLGSVFLCLLQWLWLRVYVLTYSSVFCMRGGEKKLLLSTVALIPRSPHSPFRRPWSCEPRCVSQSTPSRNSYHNFRITVAGSILGWSHGLISWKLWRGTTWFISSFPTPHILQRGREGST